MEKWEKEHSKKRTHGMFEGNWVVERSSHSVRRRWELDYKGPQKPPRMPELTHRQ